MSSPTSALSYLLHCWLLQPMAEPEPRVPHRVNPSPSWLHGSASWARIVHTECIQLVAGRLRLLWCCIFEVRCRVWSLCALTCSSGSLSLTSGVRWPAWSRATAASLSSAPPPPPPANRSPARWSPGRHWKLRTSTPTTILSPPHPHPFSLPLQEPTLLLPFLVIFRLCSYCTASLYGTEACLHKQRQKDKNRLCVQFKGLIFAQRLYIFRAWHLCWAAVWIRTLAECLFRVSCRGEG